MTSFYWFDYETFGTHAAWDRPCQFAGVRTDAELKVIGEPLVIYCRQSADYLPDPGACKVTGITPQLANEKGLCEAEFIGRIRQELAFNDTCAVGYNNIRFDDEFTRHTLFRNLYDAYEHEWKNGCSRWDLLDVVRLTRALRPDGITWPINEQGKDSNRLEHLSEANGIEHSQAHDAMSDVWATLGMARLIREEQPKLFDYAFSNRGKQAVSNLLNTRHRSPCLQVSGMIPGERKHISAILPIAQHPNRPNSIIVLDLEHDSSYLADLCSEEITRRVFARTEPGSALEPRIGLRTVQINKCPVLVPLSVLRPVDEDRLGIDRNAIVNQALQSENWLNDQVISQIVHAMNRQWPEETTRDVDGTLYGGGFLSQSDKQRLAAIRDETPERIMEHVGHFDDRRLDEMVWRYKARNYPHALSMDEVARWKEHCSSRLHDSTAPWLTFEEFAEKLSTEFEEDQHQHSQLAASLGEYANALLPQQPH